MPLTLAKLTSCREMTLNTNRLKGKRLPIHLVGCRALTSLNISDNCWDERERAELEAYLRPR